MAEKKWMPRWFYQLASPRGCYQITGRLLPWFSVAALLLLTPAPSIGAA